jgi:hypothetical protein
VWLFGVVLQGVCSGEAKVSESAVQQVHNQCGVIEGSLELCCCRCCVAVKCYGFFLDLDLPFVGAGFGCAGGFA